MATLLKPFDEIGASHRRAIPITFAKEMKILLIALAIGSTALAHPPIDSPASDSLDSKADAQFKNGDSVTIVAKDYKIKSLGIFMSGTNLVLPDPEFSDIPFPDLGMLSVPTSNGLDGNRLSIVLEFGKPPKSRGGFHHDGLVRTVRFDFVDQRYEGRTITIRVDPLKAENALVFFKAPGKEEVQYKYPGIRQATKDQRAAYMDYQTEANKAEMATPRKPSD